ncbi:uncharacterized protein V1513DRAFT_412295 [Lipomyces chichibuensis]|uniref:uncharacterized protein n=1 Tax=Lipomyces chichibuensis TaxID=1546026 RepID=UPI0033441334
MPCACQPLMARATHYEALNLHHTATTAEIKARFYALSKKYHPDRLVASPDTERQHARQRFQAVSEAYSILGNPKHRKEYDRTMRNGARNSTAYSDTSETHNTYYRTSGEKRQRYSGLNRTHMRSKAGYTDEHYGGFGHKMPRSSYPTNPYNAGLGGGYATGLNDDVPHFDYEKHMRQQLAYESFRKERDRQKAAAKQGPLYASVFSSINLDPDAYRARSATFESHPRAHPYPHPQKPTQAHPQDKTYSSFSQSSSDTTQSRKSATDSSQHIFRPTTARFTQATQSQSQASYSSPSQPHMSTATSSTQNAHTHPRARTQTQRQPHTYPRSAVSSISSSEFQLPSTISPGKIVGVLGFITASMYITLLATGVM